MKEYIIAVSTPKGLRFLAPYENAPIKNPLKARVFKNEVHANNRVAVSDMGNGFIAVTVFMPTTRPMSPFYTAMCEMKLLAKALELCKEFVYGIRNEYSLLRMQPPIEKYFGYSPEENETIINMPSPAGELVPFTVHCQRMVVTDCLMSDVRDSMSFLVTAHNSVWDRVE